MDTSNAEKVKSLRKMKLFKGMTEEELKILAEITQTETYVADEEIFHPEITQTVTCTTDKESDQHTRKGSGYLYFINKGSVEITLPIMVSDNRQEAIATLNEGDCFGELSFFDENGHSAYVISLSDVELFKIAHKDYEEAIKRDLELGFKIQKKLVQMIINLVREMDSRYSFRPFSE